MATEAAATGIDEQTVVRRIVATGTLTLLSAAHFGGGPTALTDAALLRTAEGEPYLPGASLAGACRDFLRRHGVRLRELELLFGGRESGPDEDDRGLGSALAVDDAYLIPTAAPEVVIRDHVRLDAARRTAADQGKFDAETIGAGAAFGMHVELALRQRHSTDHERLCLLFNAVLDALGNAQIRLGAHSRRGFGRGEVALWQIQDFDFRDRGAVVRWLRNEPAAADAPQRCGSAQPGDAIATLTVPPALRVTADLAIAVSLLVRTAPAGGDRTAPDVVQFRSGGQPLLPGSSLAGALRHRALRICRTLSPTPEATPALVEEIFGTIRPDDAPTKQAHASRLRVEEAPIRGSVAQRQTRIAIDRFTGAAYPTALIEELPEWSIEDAEATLRLELRLEAPFDAARWGPSDAECGLILLLLKDLCTGDLTVGGEAGVGRGVLRGRRVTVERQTTERERWAWDQIGGELHFEAGDPRVLEGWVQALVRELAGERHAGER